MPDDKHRVGATVTSSPDEQSVSVSWESPLPPPAILSEYERILPGSAREYFDMFKAQASHRQKMETIHMERAYKLSSRGMALGFIVNVSTMGAAVVLAMLKMDGAAIAAIVAAILTNLSFFSSFLVKSKN